MTEFVFAYRGGAMAPTPQEREQVMAAWGRWFGELGAAVVSAGAPFGASTTVASSGVSGAGGSSGLGGYSVVRADSLDAAAQLAEGCPILAESGTVEVYEALAM